MTEKKSLLVGVAEQLLKVSTVTGDEFNAMYDKGFDDSADGTDTSDAAPKKGFDLPPVQPEPSFEK